MEELERAAFAALVVQHQAALYRTARSILHSDQDAADAVQEAICLAYASRSRLRDLQKWKAWMLRILVNVCYSALRKRHDTASLDEVEVYLAAPETDHSERLSLWDTVCTLPEQMRIVVTLFYYEDLSVRQISQILKISQGAVRTRLSRARDQLRQMLEEEE